MLPDVTDTTITGPPEWALLTAVRTAWPADPDEWNGDLEPPRRDVTALVRALSETNSVRLLVNGPEAEASARAALAPRGRLISCVGTAMNSGMAPCEGELNRRASFSNPKPPPPRACRG